MNARLFAVMVTFPLVLAVARSADVGAAFGRGGGADNARREDRQGVSPVALERIEFVGARVTNPRFLQTGSTVEFLVNGSLQFPETTTNVYDDRGNLVQVVTTSGDQVVYTAERTYHRHGDVLSLVETNFSNGDVYSIQTTRYLQISETEIQSLITAEFPSNAVIQSNVVWNFTVTTTLTGGGAPLLQIQSPVTPTAQPVTNSWTYDYANHSVVVSVDGVPRTTYTLDDRDRPLSTTSELGLAGGPHADIITGTYAYDPFGNLVEFRVVIYEWDPLQGVYIHSDPRVTTYFYARRAEVLRNGSRPEAVSVHNGTGGRATKRDFGNTL